MTKHFRFVYLFASCLLLVSNVAVARDLTLQDVIDGLKTFESRFSHMKCNYTRKEVRTELCGKLQPGLGSGTLVHSYGLLLDRQERAACIHYTTFEGKQVPEYVATFDGGKSNTIQYVREKDELRASGQINLPSEQKNILPCDQPLTEITDRANGATSLAQFLQTGPPQGQLQECRLIETRRQDGELLCIVQIKYKLREVSRNFRDTFTLNADKGFWPVHITQETGPDRSGDSDFVLTSETSVFGLKPVSGFYFPSSIRSRIYLHPEVKILGAGGRSLEERLTFDTTYEFSFIDLAPQFTAKDFAIEFPKNSLYHDSASNENYRIDEAGKVEKVVPGDPKKTAMCILPVLEASTRFAILGWSVRALLSGLPSVGFGS